MSEHSRVTEPPIFRFRATRFWESEPYNILVKSQGPPFLLAGGPEHASHLDDNRSFLFGNRARPTHVVPFGVYSERVVDGYVHAYVGHRRYPCCTVNLFGWTAGRGFRFVFALAGSSRTVAPSSGPQYSVPRRVAT